MGRCWNAVRDDVGVTGSRSSLEPRSLAGDHLTPSWTQWGLTWVLIVMLTAVNFP